MSQVVVDSSSLFALERGGLVSFLTKIPYTILIPPAVKEEIAVGSSSLLSVVTVHPLQGRTLKKARALEYLNIGKGEAACCALAFSLNLGFIVCDDRKFLRQRFFSSDSSLKEIIVVGFSYFLDILYKEKLISDVWIHFNTIIKRCNWERSEVQIANYTFLKELRY